MKLYILKSMNVTGLHLAENLEISSSSWLFVSISCPRSRILILDLTSVCWLYNKFYLVNWIGFIVHMKPSSFVAKHHFGYA